MCTLVYKEYSHSDHSYVSTTQIRKQKHYAAAPLFTTSFSCHKPTVSSMWYLFTALYFLSVLNFT